ncbi:MAG: site-specific integrase [Pirellulales bacterium]|nr:site-specific integrase [Pirellulales bacterium]
MGQKIETDEIKSRKRTKRRGNGEGSIYQRSADGRWIAMISTGYDATGKRRRRAIYGWTKKEVQDKLSRLQTAKLDGTLSEPTKQTVAAFLTRWLEDAARPTIKETTYVNYKAIIKNHIAPRIGGIALQKLTPANVQWLYGELERDGRSVYVRRQVHAALHRALKIAVKWGLIPRNAAHSVEPPRVPATDIHQLDPEQVGTLLDAARGDRLEALYVLAISSGMRLGELFALQWADIDLKAGAVMVRHTLTEINGKLTLTEPKSAKGRRRIDLPAMAITALHEHRKRQLADGHGGGPWVFCNRSGGPLRKSHFQEQKFYPLLKSAGLPRMRFHDLRHTAASLLLALGVHPKVVQERLGHSQISVTMDVYSHVMPTMQREAAGQLDSLLEATKAKAKVVPASA